jgi:hypothetical protein
MNSEIKKQFSLLKNSTKLPVTISTDDLFKNQYDMETLEYNMIEGNLFQWEVLITQQLTPDFCAKYLLDEKYSACDKERYICNITILNIQRHISETELEEACKKIWNNEDK